MTHVGVASPFTRAVPVEVATVVRELRSGRGAYHVVARDDRVWPLSVDAHGVLGVGEPTLPLGEIDWLPEFEPGELPDWAFGT